ncbi:MAG: tRNA glutamyl-Q(34) synthetase GluQRS [Phycisphaeraceae bacterium]|nr:MAG: tRNA glutamyl-Q(34) synthetase GluQRS [Phycisphaeraceae bacterium]
MPEPRSAQPAATPTTRLAPSPTGALHLGNARTFLINWALARTHGWRLLLRIEDLDSPRVKADAARQAIDDLAWLGIEWDGGPITQSDDLGPYRAAAARLAADGRIYPSAHSRAELESLAADLAASAPNQGDHEVPFPASLRPTLAPREFSQAKDSPANWRFATPDRDVPVPDAFAGDRVFNPARTVGDFIVWTKKDLPAYQLAVVVDDHRQGVTHVVRGDDLLDSAARQSLLYDALSLGPPPAYSHLPLVLGPDGRRLAKRHGDTRLAAYRARGVPPERVIGLIAHWSGVTPGAPAPLSAEEFRRRLTLDTIPRHPVTMTPENDAWLLNSRPPTAP